ncbi:MAG: flavodoxin family protein [Syntrophales bacterium]|nr:flavodoxin family protein [Syntrophales bacterium]
MNVVCILGSPRPKGNSTLLAKSFCNAARNKGARVKIFQLNKLNFRGCQACMACKTKSEHCIQKDDLEKVLKAVEGCDVLVLASPIYYGDVSSQLKAFIDRTYSFLKSDYTTNPEPSRLSPGKKLVFILTQGQPDKTQFADVFPRYESFFKWYGFTESELIRVCGVMEPAEVEKHEEAIKITVETAEKICNRGNR